MWIPTPSGLRCDECETEFPVGASCACDPGAVSATLLSVEVDATGTNEPLDQLLTHSGRLERLAALASEVRVAEGHVEIKRAECELKLVRAIVEMQEKHEDAARIVAVEAKLAALDEALNQTRGFAAREDRAVIPPAQQQGEEHN